ncbi:MAG: GDP-mannose 4,6-dehydratase [Anaerolineales bacterium]|jgi:GDPmannose 4,6-dehydratase
MPVALITGINGQDGSYLAEFLLEKGYEVIGWVPDHLPISYENFSAILHQISLVKGNLSDQEGINRLITEYQPDEIYHFASPSSPSASWQSTVSVGDAAGLAVARLLEAVRYFQPQAKFYQASSSELFGNPVEVPQDENTPFHPRNPYGISKLYAHWMVVNYRERYDLFATAGILFNHESPRRGQQFVTRKITNGAARIKLGLSQELRLGNLEARRDWGFAGDYVQAIYALMHQDQPNDYVIGTGVTHSVREFCERAFQSVDLDYREFVVVAPEFYRPEEQRQLVANPEKAQRELGWQSKTSFDELVRMMVQHDLKLLQDQE